MSGPLFGPSPEDPRSRGAAGWQLPKPLRALSRKPTSSQSKLGLSLHNRITIWVDGDETYHAMLHAIDTARVRVWLETYIFVPDRVGELFLQALKRAADRGVQVVLLVDAFGASKLSDEHVEPLRQAGARVVLFNAPLTLRRRRPPLQRNHRKIMVADDVAFCGGMNISEEYAGPRLGTGTFRDTHARLQGPCVRDFADLIRSTARHEGVHLGRTEPPPSMAQGLPVQVLQSDVLGAKRQIQRALLRAIGQASERVWLTTPYFVPPPRLLRALVAARRRGVDVAVLTAGISDVPVVSVAARHLYGALLRSGVRVMEFSPSGESAPKTLHAKTATVDGAWSMIGSFNLDRWSFERNLEVCFSTPSADVAQVLQQVFHADTASSQVIGLQQWQARSLWDRVLGWLAYQLMRL